MARCPNCDAGLKLHIVGGFIAIGCDECRREFFDLPTDEVRKAMLSVGQKVVDEAQWDMEEVEWVDYIKEGEHLGKV